jgi:hypothetical protein
MPLDRVNDFLLCRGSSQWCFRRHLIDSGFSRNQEKSIKLDEEGASFKSTGVHQWSLDVLP